MNTAEYIYFSLIVMQFICTLFADLSAINNKQQMSRDKTSKYSHDEYEPLINHVIYEEDHEAMPVNCRTSIVSLSQYYQLLVVTFEKNIFFCYSISDTDLCS